MRKQHIAFADLVKAMPLKIITQSLVAAGVLAALPVVSALAADAKAEEKPEEIVVTATRRESKLQDTPIAVTAFSESQLRASGITDLQGFSALVPGFVVGNQNGTVGSANLTIRGVGTQVVGAGLDVNVAVYVDGVYMPRATTTLQSFLDVQRIEILRGPQGTQFGRNATGGAVSITSKRPTKEFEASVDASFGDYGLFSTRASVSGPLDENVRGRISVMKSERDNYSFNITRGSRKRDGDSVGARGALEFTPTKDLTITLSGHYFEDKAFGLFPLRNPFPAAGLIARGAVDTPDPFRFTSDVDPTSVLKDQSSTATVVWNLDDVTLKSISAYQKSSLPRLLEVDGTAVVANTNRFYTNSDTFSQELQLLSRGGGPLTWLGGLYYLKEDAAQAQISIVNGTPTPEQAQQIGTKAKAIFAQANYRFTDRFSASLGLRKTEDVKTLAAQLGGVPRAVTASSKKFSGTTPKFGLEYKPSDDVLLYTSVSKGYKSGGFPTTTPFIPFDPEELNAVEVGVKSSFDGGRLTLNVAAFDYDYKKLQIVQVGNFVLGGTAATSDVITPNARNKGGEIELAWRPSSAALVTASLAFLNAKFTNSLVVTNTATNLPVNLQGLDVPRSPRQQASFMAQYRFSLDGLGALTPRLEYVYQDKVALNQFSDPKNNQGSYGLTNVRLQWDLPGRNASIALWSKNISNTTYKTTSNTAVTIGQFDVYGAPRTTGVDLRYRF
ncbi:MAG: TonB-dependent receptor [Betaproteobacteria bacterium]|jgi:iron complex outermembrane receptor protein|nr:TonB-dependent receptor [Betaproteobacteria bacterium]